ncbi:MAG: ABC transporter permease, partial [Bdellovibrio sp.]|nr:ABC transporter permease [Bdellovibrio sp.]
MTTFITRRILQTLAVIVVLSYVVFFMMSLMPGDPVDMMVASNPKITSEDVARLKALYGLDQPIYKRYGNWIASLATGDLGYSRTYRVPVQELMGPRLWNTFVLSAISLVLSVMIAVPLGVMSALRPGSKLDYFMNLFSFA